MDQNKTFAFLTRIERNLEDISASGGSIDVAAADGAIAVNARQIIVRTPGIITAMTGTDAEGATVNFVTLFNISGKTLEATTMYKVPDGYRIKSITMTPGALVAYN